VEASYAASAVCMGVSAAAFQQAVYGRVAVHGDAPRAMQAYALGFSAAATLTTGFAASMCGGDTFRGAKVSLAAGGAAFAVVVAVYRASLAREEERGSGADGAAGGEGAETNGGHGDDDDDDDDDAHSSRQEPLLRRAATAARNGAAAARRRSPWPALLAVLLVMAGSLLVVPVVLSAIEPASGVSTSRCAFTTVLLTLFNAGDMAGRAFSHRMTHWSPPAVLLLAALRTAALLPFFALAFDDGDPRAAPWIPHTDEAARALAVLHGLLNGLIFTVGASLAPAHAPRSADRPRFARLVGLATAVGLSVGSSLGALVAHVMG